MQRLLLPFDTGALSHGPGVVLVLNAAETGGLKAFDRLHAVQPLRDEHDRLLRAGRQVTPETPDIIADTALVRMTKSRGETRGLVAEAWDQTKPSGTMVISGAKTDGADTMTKDLRRMGLEVETLAKAHGKVIWFTRTAQTPEIFKEWATAAQPRRIAEGYLTADGLFSADGPDPASVLLANEFTEAIKGEAADLGSGWGYLSAELLKRAPRIEKLHLIEVDHRALDLAKTNVGDDRAAHHWVDATDRSALPNGLDLIVTNPPFHQGRATAVDLGQRFLQTSAELLNPKGKLLLVANRHLPYETTLRGLFRNVTIRIQTHQFKVIEATRPSIKRR